MLWIRYAGLEAGGHNGDVAITNFSGVSNDLRLDRTDRLGSHGQMAGRDYITKRVWTLTLTTLADDENGAVALASAWERAALNDDVMLSQDLALFEYSRDRSTWHQVFGRPSDYAGPDLGDHTREGAGQITLQFEQLDPLYYSQPHSATLLPSASAFEGGLIAPLIAPLVASGTSSPSAVAVSNRGDQLAPLRITFHGPSVNPRAWAGPVEVVYRGALAWDEFVTIDGMSLSVMLHGGGRTEPVPVPGRLSPHTLLTDLTVPVGVTHWWYEAIDESLQSKAEFTWWDAYQSMQ